MKEDCQKCREKSVRFICAALRTRIYQKRAYHTPKDIVAIKMLTSLVLLLYSQVAPYLWDTKNSAPKRLGEDPKTLLGLLERAARLWPNHGIAFKDQGWDQKSDFVTYAELLREVTVRFLVPDV